MSVSASSFDKDISMELREDEELLWQGAPQKASFVLSKTISFIPFALIWLLFDGFIISMLIASKDQIPTGTKVFLTIFFAIHLMPVWICIHSIVSSSRQLKGLEYAFTDQRIIVLKKNILKSYYYRDLRNVNVKVRLIDKIFRVGDLTISGEQSVQLLDLSNPYAVAEKLQDFINNNRRRANRTKDNKEYEDYIEYVEDSYYTNYDNYDPDIHQKSHRVSNHDDDDFYDDNNIVIDTPSSDKNFSNEYEHKSSGVRYTSKKKPTPPERTDEDDYLDNLMSSIKNKDDDEF